MSRALLLPFAYTADVLPSSRHKYSTTVTMRDYQPVLVNEVAPHDLVPAIWCSTPGEDGGGRPDAEPYFSYRGRLFRRLHERDTGKPLAAKEFEDAVSERSIARAAVTFGATAGAAARIGFPRRGMRWSANVGNPLDYPTEETTASALNWKRTRRHRTTTFVSAKADAQWFLGSALLSVEGEIYAACTEPVWAVDANGAGVIAIRLEREPQEREAHRYFRLDRLEAAREWAAWMGGRDGGPPNCDVEILREDAIERDDEWAMARTVKKSWQSAASLPLRFDDEPVETLDRAVAVARKAQRSFTRDEVPDVLNAVERLGQMHRARRAPERPALPSVSVLELIGERWRFFREALALEAPELDEADMAALEGCF